MYTGLTSCPTPYYRAHGPQAQIYLQETHVSDANRPVLVPTSSETPIRSLVLGLGVWLVATALLGPQHLELVLNTAAAGIAVCIAVLLRTHARAMRITLWAMPAWLAASSLVLPYGMSLALWNNLATTVALFALSFGADLGYQAEPRSFLRP